MYRKNVTPWFDVSMINGHLQEICRKVLERAGPVQTDTDLFHNLLSLPTTLH